MLLFASIALSIHLTAWNGLWLADIKTPRGEHLRMLVDTGSNLTLVFNPGIEREVCIAIDNETICSGPTQMMASVPNTKALSRDDLDGILGNDFLGNFSTISIDRKNRILTLEK